jgi:hypothetical protein
MPSIPLVEGGKGGEKLFNLSLIIERIPPHYPKKGSE